MWDTKDYKDHRCRQIRCVGCSDMQEMVRERLAEKLEASAIVQSTAGECDLFRVGDDVGAVHSEPKSRGDRIFLTSYLELKLKSRSWQVFWACHFRGPGH